MRVLIVGCGYVGLPLGAALVARGHHVVGLRRSPAAEAEMRAAGIEPAYADITDRPSLDPLPLPFDWVVNCVASGGGGLKDYRHTYLEGTRHLLDWLGASPPAKFIYTGSTGVYGQTDGADVDETSPTKPVSATARTLVTTERVLLKTARERGFPAIVLRLAGIYGPARGYWLRQFIAGEARMEGEGRRILNMVHRDDVVGAILTVCERGQAGEVYNVVDDAPVTQRGFFTWLATRLNRPLPPAIPEDGVAKRKRGLTNKRVSNRKLKVELGYQFRYPTFREGFEPELEALGFARQA
jgi:nucleoside-diphosphate-sugar epimerase